GIAGLWLVIFAWGFVRQQEEMLLRRYPDWMEPITLAGVFWGLFALPCLVSLGLWLAGYLQPRDPTRLDQSDSERALERGIFLLREKHSLRRLDQLFAGLLFTTGGFIAWRVLTQGHPFLDWLPEVHLAGA